MADKWYTITNKADDGVAEIFLYDEIGGYGIDAKSFVAELNELKADTIDLHINSVGGEVFQGFAIYQALKDHPANINVTVDGLAASIASVIAMGGDHIKMAPNAEFMIHDGHVMMVGNSADLSKMVASLDRISDNIASVYAERCGGEPAVWRDAMRLETWYSAEEAVQAGLADEVAAKSARKSRTRNVADLSVFNYAGRKFAPAPVINADKKPYGDVEYADPGYQKDGKARYPIDTEEHVRAAWSYINQEDNAGEYTAEQLSEIKARIKSAAKKYGIEISDKAVPFVWDFEMFRNAIKEAAE